MHRISIKNESNNSIISTNVSIDGKPIKAVSTSFYQSVDELPVCEIELHALPDIEALAGIEFRFTPKTITEAKKIIKHTLLANKCSYHSLFASISSALKDLPKESDLEDVSKAIADRIIEEELK